MRLDEVEGMRDSRLWREVGPGETYLLPATALLSSTTQRQGLPLVKLLVIPHAYAAHCAMGNE